MERLIAAAVLALALVGLGGGACYHWMSGKLEKAQAAAQEAQDTLTAERAEAKRTAALLTRYRAALKKAQEGAKSARGALDSALRSQRAWAEQRVPQEVLDEL